MGDQSYMWLMSHSPSVLLLCERAFFFFSVANNFTLVRLYQYLCCTITADSHIHCNASFSNTHKRRHQNREHLVIYPHFSRITQRSNFATHKKVSPFPLLHERIRPERWKFSDIGSFFSFSLLQFHIPFCSLNIRPYSNVRLHDDARSKLSKKVWKAHIAHRYVYLKFNISPSKIAK